MKKEADAEWLMSPEGQKILAKCYDVKKKVGFKKIGKPERGCCGHCLRGDILLEWIVPRMFTPNKELTEISYITVCDGCKNCLETEKMPCDCMWKWRIAKTDNGEMPFLEYEKEYLKSSNKTK